MRKVLVVDDSKTIRTMCEWIYKGLEDHLLTADSADAARQIISRESPDVVVVDYTLPDMDAYEFVSSIKDLTRVIMLGGQFAPFSESKATASGAVAVIQKPFKTAEFFEAIDKAMSAEKAAAPATENAAAPAEELSISLGTTEMPALVSDHLPEAPVAESIKEKAEHHEPAQPTTSSVPPIGGFVAPASRPAPISSSHPRIAAGEMQAQSLAPAPVSNASISPFGGSKRFNFPGQTSQSAPTSDSPAVSQFGGASSPGTVSAFSTGKTHNSAMIQSASSQPDRATPKSPISAAPTAQPGEQPQVQIDPAVLRAEVIAAVKSLLPAIVNSYLKKLIQAEVKPQLQNWVDTRVEALIKKMTQQ